MFKNSTNYDRCDRTNYFSPGQLEVKMEELVKYYNYLRYHESLDNLTPSDVYFGTGHKKIKQRKLIKNRTMEALESYLRDIDAELPKDYSKHLRD